MDMLIDDIEFIMEKYCNHPSIRLISPSYTSKLFSFENVIPDQSTSDYIRS